MNYHNITKTDLKNGDGLRVVLWVSGCNHQCKDCQNPETWDECGGIPFDDYSKQEIFAELEKDYVAGITFSGGDPIFPTNRKVVGELMEEIHKLYPNKTIWCYTGYTFEQIKDLPFLKYIDVLVDGPYIPALKELKLKWKGSSNQRVILCKQSLKENKLIIRDDDDTQKCITEWKTCGCGK